MKINLSIVVVSMLFIAYSCTPSKDDPSSSKPKEELLTNNGSRSWKITELKLVGFSTSILKECNVDDRYTFKSDKAFLFTYGTVKCESTDINYTSTWALNANKDSISVPITFATYGKVPKAKIVELNDSKMALSVSLTYSGFSTTAEVTLIPE